MKKIAAIVLFIACTYGLIAQPSKQHHLFNGKDLTGWKIYGTEKWYVDKGELVCESGPDKQYGYFATEKEFKDFELTVEFKQESNGNSGVFFHSSVEGTKVTGWQVEVAPLHSHTGGIYESYGRGWLIQPAVEKDNYLKEGDWNQMKIKVKGNKVTTWLNGHEMVILTDPVIGSSIGKIALQIHDGAGVKVRSRKVAVEEL